MPRKDILANRLANEIDSVVTQRLAKINDPAIRKAIEEALRDQVYENVGDEVSQHINRVVEESLNEIISSIQVKPAKKKSKMSQSFTSNDNGGKDSGGKNQAPPRRAAISPRRVRDSGGKPGFGGK